jgi:predicted RNase H-like HicB family nuclease
MATLTIRASFPVNFTEEDGVVVASCDKIGVYSQGCTFDDARKNIEEAVNLFLLTCFEMGTLDEVLKECGFALLEEGQVDNDLGGEHIDVVLPFIAARQNRECRA